MHSQYFIPFEGSCYYKYGYKIRRIESSIKNLDLSIQFIKKKYMLKKKKLSKFIVFRDVFKSNIVHC